MAERALPGDRHDLQHADVESGLTLLGIVGIIDPPRTEAIQAVEHCQQAGIRVVMITGDHGVTASAIAGQIGLGGSGVAITGPEIEALDDAGLREVVRDARVFARASPEHKLRLVRAMQAIGRLRPGAHLEVLTATDGAPAAYARWADRAGHRITAVDRVRDHEGRPAVRILIRRAAGR
jgi:high-affinity K+ transport system ATPase subunit B